MLPSAPLARAAALLFLSAAAACDAHSPPPHRAEEPVIHASAPPSAPPAAPTAVAVASAEPLAPAAPSYPPPPPPEPPITLHAGGKAAVRGEAGLVTSVEENASRIGADVLQKGGNAVDAAVAMAFALAVTHPSAGNIGGGGFMLVRRANGESAAIDFRETAPAAATAEKNKAMLDAGAIGYASAGVPGTVAGLSLALEKFGSRALAEVLAPAIALARKGHRLGARQALVLSWTWDRLRKDPAARAIYGHGKAPLKEGEVIVQPDLARTLEAIAREGPKGFYEGPVAEKIDRAMSARGGLITAADLAGYKARLRAPLRFAYRGFSVETMPPPSMGGVAFAQIMLTLERLHASEAPRGSGLALHLFIEASRRAYAERRLVGADPDFMKPELPGGGVARMLSGEHLATRKPPVDPDHATPSAALAEANAGAAHESPETTQLSVVDAEGNAVSCTYTQSAAFGAKIVIPGTGILLGNAMGGFSEEGVNAIAPGKRMASSMSPTIVSQNGKLALILGSPGGDTIPNTVAQVFRNLVDHGMTIDEAVAAPRIHHQFLPDKVRVEKGNAPPRAALDDLVRRGHLLDMNPIPMGDANNILIDIPTGVAWGYADPREGGRAIGVSAAGVSVTGVPKKK